MIVSGRLCPTDDITIRCNAHLGNFGHYVFGKLCPVGFLVVCKSSAVLL